MISTTTISPLATCLFICLISADLTAQPPQGGGPPGGPGFNQETRKLVEQFDEDENGWLNRKERELARAEAVKGGENQRGPGRRGPRGNREGAEAKPGRKVTPNDVESYPDAPLYDGTVLRTLFFEFENADWEKELEDFHGTDVDVQAELSVDGKVYSNVGVRFRGASSYGMVPTGYKRSFNVSIDLDDKDQRLYGFKTLNLLNSAGDPSFMSTVLYSHIASQYIPVPKANHVHVVINGESWGVYVNVQQFNKDFLGEHFSSTKGTRWKASGSPGADAGLRYLGDDLEEYKQRFEMKSNDGKKAWERLVELCRVLNEAPLERLESELEPLLDIDGALRFLALDIVVVNSDGYWTRASDYSLFLDSENRFHVFPHDMNEAFQAGHGPPGGGGPGRSGPGRFGGPPDGPTRDAEGFGGGRPGGGPPIEGGPPRFAPPPPREGAPNGEADDRRPFPPRDQGFESGAPRRGELQRGRGRGGPGHGGVDLDPLIGLDNPRMPLRSRLLAVPALRQRYLQYVREIATSSLDQDELRPFIKRTAELIESEVRQDTRKLDSNEAFARSTSLSVSATDRSAESILDFIEKRRAFLLDYKEPSSQQR